MCKFSKINALDYLLFIKAKKGTDQAKNRTKADTKARTSFYQDGNGTNLYKKYQDRNGDFRVSKDIRNGSYVFRDIRLECTVYKNSRIDHSVFKENQLCGSVFRSKRPDCSVHKDIRLNDNVVKDIRIGGSVSKDSRLGEYDFKNNQLDYSVVDQAKTKAETNLYKKYQDRNGTDFYQA